MKIFVTIYFNNYYLVLVYKNIYIKLNISVKIPSSKYWKYNKLFL